MNSQLSADHKNCEVKTKPHFNLMQSVSNEPSNWVHENKQWNWRISAASISSSLLHSTWLHNHNNIVYLPWIFPSNELVFFVMLTSYFTYNSKHQCTLEGRPTCHEMARKLTPIGMVSTGYLTPTSLSQQPSPLQQHQAAILQGPTH
jgi:hypothetical protein